MFTDEKGAAMKDESEKKKQIKSLSSKLRSVLLIIILIMTVSFLASMTAITRKERRDYGIREAENLLNGLANSVSSNIKGYLELSRLIMLDERLSIYLKAPMPDETAEVKKKDEYASLKNDARYGVLEILNVTNNVDVFAFREDMEDYMETNRKAFVFNPERLLGEEWRKNIYAGKGRASVSINSNDVIKRIDGKPTITLERAIYDLSQKRSGILVMCVSQAMLDQVIDAQKAKRVCFISRDGLFLAGDRELEKYFRTEFASSDIKSIAQKEGSENILISGCRIGDTPVIVMCATNVEPGFASPETVYILLSLLIVLIATTFVAGAFITQHITNPVFQLTAAMEKNQELKQPKKIDVMLPNNELGMLEDSYNGMIEHVNELIKSLLEKEKTIQKAEMRVLHEQIKPHFLYNSLETIGFLAMDAGAENVHSALETLGSFYRNFLSKGDREIPLSREIRIVQDYLSLQKLRYGDIIQDEYDIAEDTLDCIIPKLILQPLIENSIYHGIRLKGERGVIKISSMLEDGKLHIIVRDTGVGMSQEKIESVLSVEKDSEETEESESFGLWGTIERIRCYCDSEDVVRIRSDLGEYTEIELVIPQTGSEEKQEQEVNGKDTTKDLQREEISERKSRKKERKRKKRGKRKLKI
ncbi:MAG: histidine kinase [Lachnospiraceae bacterium]|nr:histidine kinase [Lachnospiraceae bacterium]